MHVVIPASFVEENTFVPLCCLCPFIRDQLAVLTGPFLGSVFLFHCMFVCSFTYITLSWLPWLWSKPWSQEASILELYSSLSVLCCLLQGFLPLHINFGISLLISIKQLGWDFGCDFVESIGSVRKNWNLDNIESFYPWTWNISSSI